MIFFSAKVLSDRQRKYVEVKRELWGIVSVVKADRDYLIETKVIIETDCIPILNMISNCASTDISMLQWIADIKSLDPEICMFGCLALLAIPLKRFKVIFYCF